MTEITPDDRKMIAEALRVYVNHLKYLPAKYTAIHARAKRAAELAEALDSQHER
jgi:hypothetical protein